MSNSKPVVLHLVSISWGGSYDYTHNIHRNLIANGYHSYICVNGRRIIDFKEDCLPIHLSQSTLVNRIKRKIHNLYINIFHPFIDPRYSGMNLTERITEYNPEDLLKALPEKPDFILVHWVSGFANAKYVKKLHKITEAKVYYVMIDEAILSGCCHYPWDCNGYQTGCKDCKMTDSYVLKKFIRWNFLFKQKNLVKQKNVIYPTTFDLQRLKKSPIWKNANTFRLIEAIDEYLFCPCSNVRQLKIKFGIPENKRVIFFGSSHLDEPRKGMHFLFSALKKLNRTDIVFLVAGKDLIPKMNQQIIYAGHLDMASLAQAYQVADLFVCPSIEDSGPQMINMSIMSGVPVVSFEMGVAIDIVIPGKTGYRAKLNDVNDLVRGIDYILDLRYEDYLNMRKECRSFACRSFTYKCQIDFFNKLFCYNNDSI